MSYTIDATGKTIGRIASEAAKALLGKTTVTYRRHIMAKLDVKIENAALARVSPKKKAQSVFTRYTGYPGGLKKVTLGELIQKKGAKAAIQKAVHGMLPKNPSRDKIMKHLTVTD